MLTDRFALLPESYPHTLQSSLLLFRHKPEPNHQQLLVRLVIAYFTLWGWNHLLGNKKNCCGCECHTVRYDGDVAAIGCQIPVLVDTEECRER